MVSNYVLLLKDYQYFSEEQITLRKLNQLFLNPPFDRLEDIACNPEEFKTTVGCLKDKYYELGNLNFTKLVKDGFLKL